MKKVISLLIVFTFMFIGISIVNAASGPTISGEKEVEVGKTTSLTASFNDGCLGREKLDQVCTQAIVDVTDKVEWSSNNDNVTVNKGIVTGIKEGTSTITATYTHTDGVKVSSTYDIKVINNTNSDNNLMVLVVFSAKGQTDEISNDTWTVNKNKTINLESKLCPINAIDDNNDYDKSKCKDTVATYSVNNNNISVNNKGIIKGLKTGESIVTIKSDSKIINLKIKVEHISLFKVPNTASTSSIVAVSISILFLITASIIYIVKINKLKVWEE